MTIADLVDAVDALECLHQTINTDHGDSHFAKSIGVVSELIHAFVNVIKTIDTPLIGQKRSGDSSGAGPSTPSTRAKLDDGEGAKNVGDNEGPVGNGEGSRVKRKPRPRKSAGTPPGEDFFLLNQYRRDEQMSSQL
jgi:hypothetical protein